MPRDLNAPPAECDQISETLGASTDGLMQEARENGLMPLVNTVCDGTPDARQAIADLQRKIDRQAEMLTQKDEVIDQLRGQLSSRVRHRTPSPRARPGSRSPHHTTLAAADRSQYTSQQLEDAIALLARSPTERERLDVMANYLAESCRDHWLNRTTDLQRTIDRQAEIIGRLTAELSSSSEANVRQLQRYKLIDDGFDALAARADRQAEMLAQKDEMLAQNDEIIDLLRRQRSSRYRRLDSRGDLHVNDSLENSRHRQRDNRDSHRRLS